MRKYNGLVWNWYVIMIELIDKNKAINKFAFAQEQMYKAISGVEDDTYKTLDTIQFCIDRINEIEPEEAEPVRHGQWIKNEAESALHVEPIYDCSACHNWQAWGDYECTPYCPYCGAKMDKVL